MDSRIIIGKTPDSGIDFSKNNEENKIESQEIIVNSKAKTFKDTIENQKNDLRRPQTFVWGIGSNLSLIGIAIGGISLII